MITYKYTLRDSSGTIYITAEDKRKAFLQLSILVKIPSDWIYDEEVGNEKRM